jgi:hypothetical protein
MIQAVPPTRRRRLVTPEATLPEVSARPCGCVTHHTRVHGHETWNYDYCLRELRMSRAAAQLAMMFFTHCWGMFQRPDA